MPIIPIENQSIYKHLFQTSRELTIIKEVRPVQYICVLYIGVEAILWVHIWVGHVADLPILHHLQPLRVMPAEFLQLDLLGPVFIKFLKTYLEWIRVISHGQIIFINFLLLCLWNISSTQWLYK